MQFIPNVITAFRIIVTPFLVFCVFQETRSFALLAFVLYLFGAASDFADGYVARMLKMQSQFGRHLDPLADKIFVLGVFLALAWLYPQQMPWWAFGVIIFRDVLITGLRKAADATGRSFPTIQFAKAKTAMQMVYAGLFLLILLLRYFPGTEALANEFIQGGLLYSSMIVVVIVTCLSGLSYIRIYSQRRTID